ncbi:aminopeptidase P family protein [Halosimplex litoreum]|uniref:Aminopeptidase P family protein n=1 Tax=Halosimplex litoreum TaxID=1198301 RepID=A0A7T3KVB4_9EURY|nr:Xaa-Pro peptidase family protein [Halosimplex litoreum]QPV63102.1 aminopeptidase P family protein [Halosimplex litoreum]
MDPDLTALDAFLDEQGVDGYLVHADSTDSTQYYLSGFDAPDPFVTLYDGDVRLFFLRSLEFGRAKREARAESVERGIDYGYAAYSEEYGPREATYRSLADFLDAHGVDSVAAPPRFPLHAADGLRDLDVSVTVDPEDTVSDIRAVKTDEEVDNVREAQLANEAAMHAAEDLIADAVVEDGILHHDGEPLTSEAVKTEIEVTLLRHGCALDETIVACGADAADPHDRGSGPLEAGEPIIIDIFPQDKATKYHADMTRTFCKGEPDERVREWYDLTEEAYRAALDAVEPGATGADVHDAACDVYEDAGEPTLRSDEGTETGFIHSTGHGVGLDVHEGPSLAPSGEELQPGHVVTIEPGLYDPAVGGVRIEDLVVVTEDGYENLTDYRVELTV